MSATAPESSLWRDAAERMSELAESFVSLLPSLVLGTLFAASGWLAGRVIRGAVQRVVRDREKPSNLAIVLGRVAYGGMLLLGLLVGAVIAFPTFTPGRLIDFLGIGSVAAGFAFRDVLQNYLAGILLLLTEPFRVGDQVVHKDYEGTIEEIQTRATFLRTYDGRRIVIPNAELFTNPITVNTAFEIRRVEYDVGIGYGDDVELAREVIVSALGRVSSVLTAPAPEVLVTELAPSSVVLRARWWIRPPRRSDVLDSRDLVLPEIKRALQEKGIDLPFPTHQVLFHDQTEGTDGDRARQREGWPAGPDGASIPARASLSSVLEDIARQLRELASR